MSNKRIGFFGNFWYTLLVCLLFTAIVAYVAYLLVANWLPAAALAYAVSSHIFSQIRMKKLKSEFIVEKINILKRFCTDKIGLARNLSINNRDGHLIYCLNDLEFLATEISKCCNSSDDQDKFKKVKGLLGSTKTTFDKANFDLTIDKPYEDVIQCVSELESYLNDI